MTTDEKIEHVTPAFEDELEPYDTGTVEDYAPSKFSPLPGECWICRREFRTRWGQVVCDDCSTSLRKD